jgi:antitoxin component YwqK of YwqJK toxin-antitoxin module
MNLQTTYYDDKITVKEVYCMMNDIKHGEFRGFYKDGKLKKLGYYNNGAMHGKYTEYYNGEPDINGSIKMICNYNKGLKQGYEKIYYEDEDVFKSKIEEEEIKSRFYEKLWQAVIQYDEIWGHKFHTFLHMLLVLLLYHHLL